MKKYILLIGLYSGIITCCPGLTFRLSNDFSGYTLSCQHQLKNIVNMTINPPEINISPDTLNGEGIVCIKIKIDNSGDNFYMGSVLLASPDDPYWQYIYFLYSDLKDNTYTYNFMVKDYYPSGHWYINKLELDYYENSLIFEAADINNGFYVINTHIDTTPPVIKHFDVSKDTAYPGDTVYFKFILEDTGSGLSNFSFEVRDTLDYWAFIYDDYYYDYSTEKRSDTVQYLYVIGKYEIPGHRNIHISIYDKVSNHMEYNRDDLEFNLVITGTTEDKNPPVVKSTNLIQNSQNGEIILEVTVTDDVSGLYYFSANITKQESYVYYSLFYQDGFPQYSDFTRINDSIYRCNILDQDPYLPSGMYSMNFYLRDSADNELISDLQWIEIYNINSDTEPPEVLSVEFSKDTVIAGDTVTVIIKLRDDKSGLQRIGVDFGSEYFYHEFDEPGTTSFIINKKITMPEFGRPGLQGIVSILVYDYSRKSEYYSGWNSTWPSFFYYPKYIDTIPPVFNSIKIEPEVVNAGDTVIVTIKASDNLSGIKNISYSDNYEDNYFLTYWSNWTMTAPETYQLSIPVNQYAKGDTIMYDLYEITDFGDNMTYLGKHGKAYIIISSGEIDTLPPVLDSLFISDTIVSQEDTLKLRFYMHDDKSGIDTNIIYAFFIYRRPDEVFQYYYQSDPPVLITELNPANDNQYTAELPGGALKTGEYKLSAIFMSDRAGNYRYPDHVGREYYTTNYTFEAFGDDDFDTDNPVITGIKILPRIVRPGDTVRIEVTAIEKGSGIAGTSCEISNSNGIDRDLITFNCWEIKGSNDTFVCRTDYIVPKEATNGKWILSYISIGDYYNNGTYYQYGNDYVDADFQVTGGHTYPNRPPTWIIPQINLTVDAGSTLSYKIPQFIVNDIDGDMLSFSSIMKNEDPLVPWIHFSSEDLVLSFEPDSNIKGFYGLFVIASDSKGLSDSIPVNLTVINQNITNEPIQQPKQRIHIYPNPASDFIRIECPYPAGRITLYDLTGKVVYEKSLITDVINVSGLSRGWYILTVETNSYTAIEKILLR